MKCTCEGWICTCAQDSGTTSHVWARNNLSSGHYCTGCPAIWPLGFSAPEGPCPQTGHLVA